MLFAAVRRSLMAQSGHCSLHRTCPLLGVKRTREFMSTRPRKPCNMVEDASAVVRKRASGAQRRRRRALARAIANSPLRGLLRPEKVGRPKGPTTRDDNRLDQLNKDLAWIGKPDLSDTALAKFLLNSSEYRDAYTGISERTLRRDVGIVQQRIWGRRRK